MRYQATVYHGGSLLGLGRCETGKQWRDRERAEREGDRMRAKAERMFGGSPIIEVAEIEDD